MSWEYRGFPSVGGLALDSRGGFIVLDSQARHLMLTRVARFRLLGRSPTGFYLWLNKQVWELLPPVARDSYPGRCYGAWLHTLVRLRSNRHQYFGTFFLRNRPALELMRRLAEQQDCGSTLRVAVLACSIGAEVYSILWTIRSARPDLKIVLSAVDISKEVLAAGERGAYGASSSALVGSSIFERLTADEKQGMFDWDGAHARIKSWLRAGIVWRLGDAADPELVRDLGAQDIVCASNFLCHMAPTDAEKCLQNIGKLVTPRGYLFVSGVDLDVRQKVASDLGWEPVEDLLAEIHDGDRSVRADWPWQWWGLEPLDRDRSDWKARYASAFRTGARCQ